MARVRPAHLQGGPASATAPLAISDEEKLALEEAEDAEEAAAAPPPAPALPPPDVPPPRRFIVQRDARCVVRGAVTTLRAGKLLDPRSYDIPELKRQGILVREEETAPTAGVSR